MPVGNEGEPVGDTLERDAAESADAIDVLTDEIEKLHAQIKWLSIKLARAEAEVLRLKKNDTSKPSDK